MDLSRYKGMFVAEAREMLAGFTAKLRARDSLASAATLAELFREAHSIKGMAATLGYESIQAVAHTLEDMLAQARAGTRRLDEDSVAKLLEAAAFIASEVDAVDGDRALSDAAPFLARFAASAPAAPIATPEMVLMPVAAPHATPADGVASPLRRRTVRLEAGFLDGLLERLTEIQIGLASLAAEAPAAARLEHLVAAARADLLAVRMTPFEALLPELDRTVRSLARDLGRETRLEVSGAEVKLDRAILDELLSPLTHLLRNAVDHGIESPAQRRAAGKPALATIAIRVRRDGDAVFLEVHDDGRGMDEARLCAKAVERGLLDAALVAALDRAQVLALALLPGLSTADKVSDISGRGVGLDVVATRVEAVGGRLLLDSTPGQGTTVTLRLPLTLAMVRVMVVSARGCLAAVPLARIHAVLDVRQDQVHDTATGLELDTGEALLPLASLPTADDASSHAPATPRFPALVYTTRGRDQALAVDRVYGEREAVVRPLGRPLQRLPYLAGAAILNETDVALFLDLDGLRVAAAGAAAGTPGTCALAAATSP